MNTLVVHPTDPTTDFLKAVYKDLNWNVINDEICEAALSEEIARHDRVIFLGHGTAMGLLGWGRLVFHEGLLEALDNNEDNIFIWCHANEFVMRHDLLGFFSGMFISELNEAIAYNIETSEPDMEDSNFCFADILHLALKSDLNFIQIIFFVKEHYYSPHCPIRIFNSDQLDARFELIL